MHSGLIGSRSLLTIDRSRKRDCIAHISKHLNVAFIRRGGSIVLGLCGEDVLVQLREHQVEHLHLLDDGRGLGVADLARPALARRTLGDAERGGGGRDQASGL